MTTSTSACETLHEAIHSVLISADQPCSTTYISDQIARRGLWVRPSDGQFPNASQVSARIGNYPDWFRRIGESRRYVVLSDWILNGRYSDS